MDVEVFAQLGATADELLHTVLQASVGALHTRAWIQQREPDPLQDVMYAVPLRGSEHWTLPLILFATNPPVSATGCSTTSEIWRWRYSTVR
jgi:hypothetical protein